MIDIQRLRTTRGVDLTVWPPRYDPAYVPSGQEEYWLPEIECADEAERNEIIFQKLIGYQITSRPETLPILPFKSRVKQVLLHLL